MSSKGHCASIERFRGILKNELVYHQDYETRFEGTKGLIKCIYLIIS